MQEFWGISSRSGTHVHTFHWPELGHMPHPIAKEAGKCSLAVCPRGKRSEFGALPTSFHYRPLAPSPPPASGLPRASPLFYTHPGLGPPDPILPPCPRSPALQLHLATSQHPRKHQSWQVREAHRTGLFLMSLYNHGTKQKVKVQTAWGKSGGPLPPLSLLSSSLHPGTHQVLNVGSCGPTVGVSGGRKEAGGR